MWFVRYLNGDGRWCQTKITEEKLTKRVRDGKIPKGLEAARHSPGDFRPLAAYPEFAGASADRARSRTAKPLPKHEEPETAPPSESEPTPRSPIPLWVWTAASVCVALTLGLGGLTVWLMRSP